MLSVTFLGVSEIMKEPVDGWFKLLVKEEGDFYSVPVPPDDGDITSLKHKFDVSKTFIELFKRYLLIRILKNE